MDPIELLLMLTGQTMPTTDRYGNPEPVDIDTLNKQGTYQGKLADLINDPLFAGMSMGNDYGAFQPTVERTPVEAFNPLEPYLNLDPESDEGAIARAIAAGASPRQAVDARAEAGGWSDDVKAEWYPVADQWFTGNAEFQQQTAGATFDPQTGQYFTETSTPSEATQRYTDVGLPSPDQQWSLDDFGPVSQYQMEAEGASQALSAQEQAIREIQSQMQQQGQQNLYQEGAVPVSQPDRVEAAVTPAAAVPQVLGENVSGMYTDGVDQSTANQAPYDASPAAPSGGPITGGIAAGLAEQNADKVERARRAADMMSGQYGLPTTQRSGLGGRQGRVNAMQDYRDRLSGAQDTRTSLQQQSRARSLDADFAAEGANARRSYAERKGLSPTMMAIMQRLATVTGGR